MIALDTRAKQLNKIWEHLCQMAVDLGMSVQVKDGAVVFVETHHGYILDARHTALNLKIYLDDLRHTWPPN